MISTYPIILEWSFSYIYKKNSIEHCKKNHKQTWRNSNTTLEAHADNNIILLLLPLLAVNSKFYHKNLSIGSPDSPFSLCPPYYR